MKTLYTFPVLFAVLLFQISFAQGPYSGSGNWLALDGVNDYAFASDHSSLDIGTGEGQDFTIECFFFVPDLNGTGAKYLIFKSASYNLFLNLSNTINDRIFFYMYYNPTDYMSLLYSVNLSVGWHHIAASYDNEYSATWDAMQIFLDGTRVSNASNFEITPGIYNSTGSLYVGGVNGNVPFQGGIDEVRISDILRYSGTTYTVPCSNFADDSNTRALWHYNEIVGSTSFDDASSNSNTQTGTNGAAALPVELTSFTAIIHNKKVILEWRTATEVNNYGFEIERKSDESEWKKINFVEGFGNSNSPNEYSYIDKNLTGGNKFKYRLKQIDNDGHFKYSDIVEINLVPSEFALLQNYPNPFNPTTTIRYNISKESSVTIKVFDVLGNEIETLVNEEKPVGTFELTWHPTKLPSGVYFYRLKAGDFIDTKRMIILK